MNVDAAVLTVLSAVVILGGLAACVASWRLLSEAKLDVAEAVRLAPGRRELKTIGDGHVRSERYRLATQICFVAVGVVGIASTTGAIPPWIRAVSRLVIVAGIVLVYLSSALAARSRRAAVLQIREESDTALD